MPSSPNAEENRIPFSAIVARTTAAPSSVEAEIKRLTPGVLICLHDITLDANFKLCAVEDTYSTAQVPALVDAIRAATSDIVTTFNCELALANGWALSSMLGDDPAGILGSLAACNGIEAVLRFVTKRPPRDDGESSSGGRSWLGTPPESPPSSPRCPPAGVASAEDRAKCAVGSFTLASRLALADATGGVAARCAAIVAESGATPAGCLAVAFAAGRPSSMTEMHACVLLAIMASGGGPRADDVIADGRLMSWLGESLTSPPSQFSSFGLLLVIAAGAVAGAGTGPARALLSAGLARPLAALAGDPATTDAQCAAVAVLLGAMAAQTDHGGPAAVAAGLESVPVSPRAILGCLRIGLGWAAARVASLLITAGASSPGLGVTIVRAVLESLADGRHSSVPPPPELLDTAARILAALAPSLASGGGGDEETAVAAVGALLPRLRGGTAGQPLLDALAALASCLPAASRLVAAAATSQADSAHDGERACAARLAKRLASSAVSRGDLIDCGAPMALVAALKPGSAAGASPSASAASVAALGALLALIECGGPAVEACVAAGLPTILERLPLVPAPAVLMPPAGYLLLCLRSAEARLGLKVESLPPDLEATAGDLRAAGGVPTVAALWAVGVDAAVGGGGEGDSVEGAAGRTLPMLVATLRSGGVGAGRAAAALLPHVLGGASRAGAVINAGGVEAAAAAFVASGGLLAGETPLLFWTLATVLLVVDRAGGGQAAHWRLPLPLSSLGLTLESSLVEGVADSETPRGNYALLAAGLLARTATPGELKAAVTAPGRLATLARFCAEPAEATAGRAACAGGVLCHVAAAANACGDAATAESMVAAGVVGALASMLRGGMSSGCLPVLAARTIYRLWCQAPKATAAALGAAIDGPVCRGVSPLLKLRFGWAVDTWVALITAAAAGGGGAAKSTSAILVAVGDQLLTPGGVEAACTAVTALAGLAFAPGSPIWPTAIVARLGSRLESDPASAAAAAAALESLAAAPGLGLESAVATAAVAVIAGGGPAAAEAAKLILRLSTLGAMRVPLVAAGAVDALAARVKAQAPTEDAPTVEGEAAAAAFFASGHGACVLALAELLPASVGAGAAPALGAALGLPSRLRLLAARAENASMSGIAFRARLQGAAAGKGASAKPPVAMDPWTLLNLEGLALDANALLLPTAPPLADKLPALVARVTASGSLVAIAAACARLGVVLESQPGAVAAAVEAGGVEALAAALGASGGVGTTPDVVVFTAWPLAVILAKDGDGVAHARLSRALSSPGARPNVESVVAALSATGDDPASRAAGLHALYMLGLGRSQSTAVALASHAGLMAAVLARLAAPAAAETVVFPDGHAVCHFLQSVLNSGLSKAASRLVAAGAPAAVLDYLTSLVGSGRRVELRLAKQAVLVLSGLLLSGDARAGAAVEPPVVWRSALAAAGAFGTRVLLAREPLTRLLVASGAGGALADLTGALVDVLESMPPSAAKSLAGRVIAGLSRRLGADPVLLESTCARLVGAQAGSMDGAEAAADALADLCTSPAVRPGVVSRLAALLESEMDNEEESPTPGGSTPGASNSGVLATAAGIAARGPCWRATRLVGALHKIAGRPGTRGDLLPVVPHLARMIHVATFSRGPKHLALAGRAAGVLLRLVTHPPAKEAMLAAAGDGPALKATLHALWAASHDAREARTTIESLVTFAGLGTFAGMGSFIAAGRFSSMGGGTPGTPCTPKTAKAC